MRATRSFVCCFYTQDFHFRFKVFHQRVYQVLVYVAFTEAPPCWLQLPPTLNELLPRLAEGDSEEKESISKFEIVFMTM